MNAAAPTFLMPSLLKSSCFLLLTALTARAAPVNASLRPGLDLNGQWHRIVDPYDTGYYDYRLQPYDAAAQPSGGFFLDRRPQAETDLIEYSFDASPLLAVPGDWNSQDERLLYYEGTVWYRRLFDYTPSGANSRVSSGSARPTTKPMSISTVTNSAITWVVSRRLPSRRPRCSSRAATRSWSA